MRCMGKVLECIMVPNNSGKTVSKHEMDVGKTIDHDMAWTLNDIDVGKVCMRKTHRLVKCRKIELS